MTEVDRTRRSSRASRLGRKLLCRLSRALLDRFIGNLLMVWVRDRQKAGEGPATAPRYSEASGLSRLAYGKERGRHRNPTRRNREMFGMGRIGRVSDHGPNRSHLPAGQVGWRHVA